jgi:hypothetical protein
VGGQKLGELAPRFWQLGGIIGPDKFALTASLLIGRGGGRQHLGELELDGTWIVVQDEVCKRPAAKK